VSTHESNSGTTLSEPTPPGNAEPLAQGGVSAASENCGMSVAEGRYAPGCSEGLGDHSSRFFLVLAGQARWECGGRRYMLGAETLCHLPAGLKYSRETFPGSPLLVYVIQYRPELLSPGVGSQLSALGMVPLDLVSTTSNQARVVRSIFQEMLFEQESRQEGWEMLLRSRLMDLAVRTLRLARRRTGKQLPAFEPGSDSTDRVARYALRLKSQFFRQESLAEAARSVGLSGRQFTELFRKVTGESWRQYILGLRLKHATRLLVETDRSVSAVAFESGFEDISNFHHSFRAECGCSPLAYREQYQVRLPAKPVAATDMVMARNPAKGFQFRGMKGWSWTPEQYVEEIPVMASLGLNFLMNCYRSMSVSRPGEPWRNEWWRPMSKERKREFGQIIRDCAKHGITFCLALHPQLASSRPLGLGSSKDMELFFQHYAWAQEQGVEWFAVCLDDTSWGAEGPAAFGASHSAFVNTIYQGLFAKNERSKMLFCPAYFWGDGSNPEHTAYLAAVARDLHPDVYVFWNGDAIVTPRITRVAAQSFKRVVRHRLFLWDNYPVNDGSPTMHLGPLSGRDPDLCEVIDGYLSNSMCSQNQINRIPLATAAEYALDPHTYKPARSVGQAIARFGPSPEARQVLKELVEAYPGFIVAGGGTGTNPVRAKFGDLLVEDSSGLTATAFMAKMEGLASRLGTLFSDRFFDAKHTLLADIAWMKEQSGQLKTLAKEG
jgi:AraC-like DNA-binding protein/mannose-6-phosphate isomerase-like protein (cupin superfamily)